MLPEDVRLVVESHLHTAIGGESSVGGGCIAHATHLRTRRGDFFLKWSRDEVRLTFEAEAAGLEALRQAGSSLVVPKVIFADEGPPGMLLLEWIASGAKPPAFWEEFGQGLAHLHSFAGPRYGFGMDNFIGRLPQSNAWSDSWIDFFVARRIKPQVKRARHDGRWDASWDRSLEHLIARFEDVLPAHPTASLLHGDLWGGNFITTASGRPVLIDPAVYFGDREADLAMTELFGGFDSRFYAAYREAWPLEPGYEERREIYNLYHLINHLNHFGGSYAAAVAGCLRRE